VEEIVNVLKHEIHVTDIKTPGLNVYDSPVQRQWVNTLWGSNRCSQQGPVETQKYEIVTKCTAYYIEACSPYCKHCALSG